MIGQLLAQPVSASSSLEMLAAEVAIAPAAVLPFASGIAALELAIHSFAGKRRSWLTFGLGPVFLIALGRVFFGTIRLASGIALASLHAFLVFAALGKAEYRLLIFFHVIFLIIKIEHLRLFAHFVFFIIQEASHSVLVE